MGVCMCLLSLRLPLVCVWCGGGARACACMCMWLLMMPADAARWPACQVTDNELITLEIIHEYVEVLDRYFGNVCELDLIFNFHKAYYILDELIIAGGVGFSWFGLLEGGRGEGLF